MLTPLDELCGYERCRDRERQIEHGLLAAQLPRRPGLWAALAADATRAAHALAEWWHRHGPHQHGPLLPPAHPLPRG